MDHLQQSASGYAGWETLPINQPLYHNEILTLVDERDFLPEITNADVDERVLYCGQTLQILTAPIMPDWRPMQKNQEIIPNQVHFDSKCLNVCNLAYTAIKISMEDIRYACGNYPQYEEKFLEGSFTSYTKMQRDWVLTSMILEAGRQNSGTHAGKYGIVDLGAKGSPVVVNKENMPLRLAELALVLQDQDNVAWKDDEMFLVVPYMMRLVLAMSNFSNAAWTGSCKPCSFAVDGSWANQLMGFNVIETTHLPMVREPDGSIGFYVIAGHPSAFVYVNDIIESRIVQNPRYFGVEYQMLATWGGKMIYPHAVAVAYWTFQTT